MKHNKCKISKESHQPLEELETSFNAWRDALDQGTLDSFYGAMDEEDEGLITRPSVSRMPGALIIR